MVKTASGKVTGRVQNVGFRDFARRAALELNLRGWVRNASDGSVEFQASGEEEHLEEFLKRLKRGPEASRVDRMTVEWEEGDAGERGFSVIG